MMRKTLETMAAIGVLISAVMLAGVLVMVRQSPVLAQGPTPTPTPGPNDRFGLHNVCSWMIREGYPEGQREAAVDTRYQYARDADVGWTRWVFDLA